MVTSVGYPKKIKNTRNVIIYIPVLKRRFMLSFKIKYKGKCRKLKRNLDPGVISHLYYTYILMHFSMQMSHVRSIVIIVRYKPSAR